MNYSIFELKRAILSTDRRENGYIFLLYLSQKETILRTVSFAEIFHY